MIGSMFFAGWACTLLWLPGFADRHGRRKLYFYGMIINLALYTILMLTRSLIFMNFVWFFFGLLTSIRSNIGYVYLVEMMPKKSQTYVTTFWNVQEALIYFFSVIYFWKISQHWQWIVLVGYCWNVISVICLFWTPESPRFLVAVGQLDEARASFRKIAWCNGREDDFIWDEQLYTPCRRAKNRSTIAAQKASQSGDSNML